MVKRPQLDLYSRLFFLVNLYLDTITPVRRRAPFLGAVLWRRELTLPAYRSNIYGYGLRI